MQKQLNLKMKNTITTFLILLGLNSMAQSENNLTKLIDKKWVIKTYEIGGQNFPATDVGKDDYTMFFQDHNVKTVDHGITMLSKWKYDSEKNTLTLYSEKVAVTTEMKIYTLNENELVWQTINPEGMTIVIHMFHITEQ